MASVFARTTARASSRPRRSSDESAATSSQNINIARVQGSSKNGLLAIKLENVGFSRFDQFFGRESGTTTALPMAIVTLDSQCVDNLLRQPESAAKPWLTADGTRNVFDHDKHDRYPAVDNLAESSAGTIGTKTTIGGKKVTLPANTLESRSGVRIKVIGATLGNSTKTFGV